MNLFTLEDAAERIDRAVPEALQEPWDNSGIQVGISGARIGKVLVCLEIDGRVADEAQALGADLIVSHHPLIFGGIRRVYDKDQRGALIERFIREGISVYSSHTPFDSVEGGLNDTVASLLRLHSVERPEGSSFVRTGTADVTMSLRDFCRFAGSALELEEGGMRVSGDLDRPVSRVGVCTGAGADFIDLAAAEGCDVFLTGDVKHHEAQKADELDIGIIDAGHYGTEKFFSGKMKKTLEKVLPDGVQIYESHVITDPFHIVQYR